MAERVDLGEAAPSNEAVEVLCRRLGAGQYRARDVEPALQRLSARVYAPLARHLTNVAHLIVCPDGQLSRVPFEMLPVPSGGTNRWLVEEKQGVTGDGTGHPERVRQRVSEVKIGEGVMSLRRAFTIAGAESVLASHWKVSDQATSRLVTEFMRRWRAGAPRAQAWHQAQLSLLRAGGEWASPHFWAAFTLTGEWR